MSEFDNSWLDDIRNERVYNYAFEDGSVISGTLKKLSELAGFDVQGEHGEELVIDERKASYQSFNPVKIHQKSEVTYEKNGLRAVMKRDGDGNITYVSETQRHYERTGKVEVQYNNAYQAQAEKNLQHQMLAEKAIKKKPGYKDPILEMVKHLQDGEYVGDGNTFVPASEYKEEVNLTANKEGL